MSNTILGTGTKTMKGEKRGYLTAVVYMKPDKEMCPGSSKECLGSCLQYSGRLPMKSVQTAMKRKTELYKSNRLSFAMKLADDITKHRSRALKKGLIPVVRVNGTSDIDVQELGIIRLFPDVQFYDYTKVFSRYSNYPNYSLTYSFNGHNWGECAKKLYQGENVAVVFRGELPEVYNDYKVIDGDKDDLRFLDEKGVIVGLKVKGHKAKKEENAFIVKGE